MALKFQVLPYVAGGLVLETYAMARYTLLLHA